LHHYSQHDPHDHDAPQPPRPRDLLGNNWPDFLLEAADAVGVVIEPEMCGPPGHLCQPPGPIPEFEAL